MKGLAGSIGHAGVTFVATVFAVTVSGCATVSGSRGADAATDARQLSRAEEVFLYQSRIADALLDRYPLMEVFQEADPVIIEAEAAMTDSCSHLTRAVLSHFEGERPSLGLRFRVMTSIGACERAARRMDLLLNATATADAI